MAHTWQHLKYATEALHYMTEVIADLEIELKKRNVSTEQLPDPPFPRKPNGPVPCIPPWNCTMPIPAVRDYTAELGAYLIAVFERTNALFTLAQTETVTEYPYRVIERPEVPEPR